MKYLQKSLEIDAFTFPAAVKVYLCDTPSDLPVEIAVGDYLLFLNGRLEVMSKKEFFAKHDEVNEAVVEAHIRKPRVNKPRKEPKIPKRGLAKPVLEPHPMELNVAEQDA